jgi:hypothetical protein
VRQQPAPRLTAVLGLARALLETVEVDEAVEILVHEFGWDLAFQSLALVRGPLGAAAFATAWQMLVLGPVRAEIEGG